MRDRVTVGVDIGGTKMLLVTARGGGRGMERVATGPETSPREIEEAVRGFVARLDELPAVIGIAVPGLVDGDRRVVACDVLPRLAGWRAADAFAGLGIPVRVLNDAEAALVEEAHDLPSGSTAALVMAGTAVGAAFRVHGIPLRGARGWAGELGYLPIATGDGVRRLDELAGGASIAARVGTDGAGLRRRADDGDADALAAIRRGGEALGLGLAGVVNLFNPGLLVLGGGALDLPGYESAAIESAESHSLPELWRACTVRRVRAGEAVAALGAARAASAAV